MGAVRTVHVYKLLATDTVEHQLAAMAAEAASTAGTGNIENLRFVSAGRAVERTKGDETALKIKQSDRVSQKKEVAKITKLLLNLRRVGAVHAGEGSKSVQTPPRAAPVDIHRSEFCFRSAAAHFGEGDEEGRVQGVGATGSAASAAIREALCSQGGVFSSAPHLRSPAGHVLEGPAASTSAAAVAAAAAAA